MTERVIRKKRRDRNNVYNWFDDSYFYAVDQYMACDSSCWGMQNFKMLFIFSVKCLFKLSYNYLIYTNNTVNSVILSNSYIVFLVGL